MRTGKLLIASTIVLTAALAGASRAQEERAVPAPLAFGGLRFGDALNGGLAQARVQNGTLTIAAGPKTDFFNEVDGTTTYGNAPVVLTRIDNAKPFTFVVRVAPKLASTYDAAVVYVWVDAKHWLKMALERDERGHARIVTVRTNGTSDDNNHDAVRAPSAFLKLSSDTKSIGFYYSIDGKTWQLVRVFRNDFPATLQLGLSAQSPTGTGTEAAFSALSFSPASVRDFRLGE